MYFFLILIILKLIIRDISKRGELDDTRYYDCDNGLETEFSKRERQVGEGFIVSGKGSPRRMNVQVTVFSEAHFHAALNPL